MNMRHFVRSFLLVAVVAIARPAVCEATPIGILSFDILIPGSGGVNVFDISDLTGPFALPPDFQVIDALTFLNTAVTLTYVDGTTTGPLALGNIGPGVFTSPLLQFPASAVFVAAAFSTTLSQTSFRLADGSIFTTDSASLSETLGSPGGPPLVAGRDQLILDAQAATPVPEPASIVLLLTGSMLMVPRAMRYLAKRTSRG